MSTSNPNHVLGIEATPDPLNDAVTYPLSVSIKQGGVYLPFTPAPPCTDIPAIGTPTGRLASVTAQTLGFCFDIYATSRDASNTLSRTILFVEDPKFTAISR